MARKMKDSGIEWIGEIPEEWEIRKGKTILTILERPVRPDDRVITCFRDGEVTLRSNRREDGFTFSMQEAGYQGVEQGDLVVHGMDGFAGAIGISDSRGKATPVLNVLNTNQNKRYIMYYLRNMAFVGVFQSLSTGIRIRSCDTNWNKLKILSYLIPLQNEQQRIADFLDQKCAQIDEILQKTRDTIAEYKKLKQSVITQAVTKGVRGERPMKDSGIEWIGEIPEEWLCCKTLYCLSMPITDGPHTTPDLYDNGIPFVSAEAVSCGNGKVDFSHIRGYISQEFYEECSKKYVPQRDDLYMIKSGATTGKVAIVDTDVIFTIWSPLAVFRCNKQKMLPKFLFYFIQSVIYQKQIELGWSYGTQQNISMRTLEKLQIFVPNINEQQEIAQYLDEKCAEIDKLIEKKEQLVNELESYKKSLIYEYVTGKKEVIL